MTEDSRTDDDRWLTLAEIAEELRMNPATIRAWVSNGTLAATRAGQRKWLVRRSEVDRMLAGRDLHGEAEPGGLGEREMDLTNPPGRSPHWPPEAVEHVTRSGWLGVTEHYWREALTDSATAPPDDGFRERLEHIASAAARKAAALANLEHEAPRRWWEHQTALPGGVLSYELRPAGSRPGPSELWSQFDTVVERLSSAMASHSATAEQEALERLSLVLHEIIDALEDVDENVGDEDVGEPSAGPDAGIWNDSDELADGGDAT